MNGVLYVVATPIGNLGDITFRAVETLKNVDAIAVEDTRITCRLLAKYEIKKPLISYHDNNEITSAEKLIKMIESGQSIALVSDAGTPALSDPGYRIVNKAHKNGIKVVTIPGASSVTSAISISGLPTDHCYFEGFLPRKKGRKSRLEMLSQISATLVIFESPFRVVKTLTDIRAVMGERAVSICREMTKVHEEVITGTVSETILHLESHSTKGEFVILVAKDGYQL